MSPKLRWTRREVMLAVSAAGIMNAEANSRLAVIVNDKNFRGRIDASQVDVLMSEENLRHHELMLKLLPVAKRRAHPPLSNYFVGAVALGSSGSLYLGQNIEIRGNMLGLAVHAEQAAIANAYMSDEAGVKAIAVTAAPCGHCRQFLSEVSLDLSMQVLLPNSPPLLLSELLPRAFGPTDLGLQQGSFPVRSQSMSLSSNSTDKVVLAALNAACASYYPYSKSPSGVALSTSSGRLFAGSYIENAAFNPSLPPLESALAGYFAAGPGAGDILRAVLVEGQSSAISHQITTRSVLAAISPSARYERFTLA